MWLRKPALTQALRTIVAVAVVCAILALCFHLKGLRNTTTTYSLLLAILYFATQWGRLETVTASVVAAVGFETYFQPPIGSFEFKDFESWVAVGAFLVTAITVSQTALLARQKAAMALQRERETDKLYHLGQAMLASDSPQTTAYIAAHQMIPVFGASSAVFYMAHTDETLRAGPSPVEIDDQELRTLGKEETPSYNVPRQLSVIPVWLGNDWIGTLAIQGVELPDSVLRSIGSLLSVVFERVKAADKLRSANQELEKKNEVVEQQRRMSESLLLNILPADIAEELRSKGMVSPRYFEDVTILFTDFVGFTLATEKLAAEELVRLLNDYFTAFDRIVARYGLEKMKTIGDSYMCLCGLPSRNPAHPVDTVMAAFEMLKVVEDFESRGPVPWKVRIGIHTGPVIAGVVGINKFAFDIWGDTVNYSSRMESSGSPNRINLSERTYSRVKDFFACEYRGKVLTKEKKELDMYFANGILPGLVDHVDVVPPPAFVHRYKVYFQKAPPDFPAFLLDGVEPTAAWELPSQVGLLSLLQQ